jgi:hypothetical protein
MIVAAQAKERTAVARAERRPRRRREERLMVA